MSLLLDALKNAALEKQRRDNAAPQNIFSSFPVEAINNTETGDAPLEFDIETIEESYLQTTAKEPELLPISTMLPIEETKEPVQKPLPKQPSQNHSPTPVQPSQTNSPTPVPSAAAESTPDTTHQARESVSAGVVSAGVVQSAATGSQVTKFDALSGKDALNRLLSRSTQAAKSSRKRLLMIYAALILTSVTLVAAYYYLLSIGNPLTTPMAIDHVPLAAEVVDTTTETEVLDISTEAEALETNTEAPQNAAEPTQTQIEGSLFAPTTTAVPSTPAAQTAQIAATAQIEQKAQPEQKATQQSATAAEITANASSKSVPLKPQAVPVKPQAKPVKPQSAPVKAIAAAAPTAKPDKQAITSHQASVERVSESISRGYKAYQSGDLATAEAAYREALSENPYQRDALLGAAAVAVQSNRYEEALRYYQQRLAHAPKDEYAQAGILALTSNTNSNPQFDSELNRLLREFPNAVHLYFLKGSMYASRQQWGAAQQAFFEAWQRDNQNPDFAFNLAIAMDHLGESKDAMNFYQQALALSPGRQVGFSTQSVQQRLQALEQASQ